LGIAEKLVSLETLEGEALEAAFDGKGTKARPKKTTKAAAIKKSRKVKNKAKAPDG
jgi:hypothetical protein